AVEETIGPQHLVTGIVDLLNAPRQLETHDTGAIDQSSTMIGEPENRAIIGALPLEHRGGVVHRVGQDVHLRVAPRNQPAIEPDEAVAIVVGAGVDHGILNANCIASVRWAWQIRQHGCPNFTRFPSLSTRAGNPAGRRAPLLRLRPYDSQHRPTSGAAGTRPGAPSRTLFHRPPARIDRQRPARPVSHYQAIPGPRA